MPIPSVIAATQQRNNSTAATLRNFLISFSDQPADALAHPVFITVKVGAGCIAEGSFEPFFLGVKVIGYLPHHLTCVLHSGIAGLFLTVAEGEEDTAGFSSGKSFQSPVFETVVPYASGNAAAESQILPFVERIKREQPRKRVSCDASEFGGSCDLLDLRKDF